MGALRTRAAVPGREEALAAFRDEACSAPRPWSNAPRAAYDWHTHDYHKVLFCLEGSIVFHTREGDVELAEGDRLDMDPGTEHAATVGADGVSCVEASR
ncbi:MAG TPA: cupin domain-containing protein [Actinomycetota bacterium]